MTTINSDKLLTFIDKHILSNITIQPIEFTNNTINILSKLFQRIELFTNVWKTTKISYSIIDYDPNINIDNYPDQVKLSIVSMNKVVRNVNFNINGHQFGLNIICDTECTKTPSEFNKIIKRIYIWLSVATEYSTINCSEILNIYFFITNHTKQLPEIYNSSIGQSNSNSAYTYACKRENELHIYREEEWFKVFIHETFHSLGLDFAMIDSIPTNNTILQLFPVKSDVRLSETYSEIWAETINIMFIAYNNSNNSNSNSTLIERMLSKTKHMLQKEQKLSMFQCAKILDFYGLSYNELLVGSNKLTRKYKEDTHILSYYIIKSIVMYNINDFFEWCSIHNISNSIQFNSEYRIENSYLFCQFVYKLYNNPIYVKNMNNTITNVSNINIKMADNSKYKPFMKTLIMAIHDV
jgi:hypothetical protein